MKWLLQQRLLIAACLLVGFFIGGAAATDGLFGAAMASWVQGIGSLLAVATAVFLWRRDVQRAESARLEAQASHLQAVWLAAELGLSALEPIARSDAEGQLANILLRTDATLLGQQDLAIAAFGKIAGGLLPAEIREHQHAIEMVLNHQRGRIAFVQSQIKAGETFSSPLFPGLPKWIEDIARYQREIAVVRDRMIADATRLQR